MVDTLTNIFLSQNSLRGSVPTEIKWLKKLGSLNLGPNILMQLARAQPSTQRSLCSSIYRLPSLLAGNPLL
jgi:hypothetical protein